MLIMLRHVNVVCDGEIFNADFIVKKIWEIGQKLWRSYAVTGKIMGILFTDCRCPFLHHLVLYHLDYSAVTV